MNPADPIFFEELREKIRKGESPVGPMPKALLRKRVESLAQRSLVLSASLHFGVAALALVETLFPGLLLPRPDPSELLKLREMKTAIRVDLVGLPNVKLDDMANIDPTEEVGKSEPPAEAKPDEPSENAMKLPDAEAAKAAEAKKTEEAKKIAEKKRLDDARKRLDTLRASMRADQKRQAAIDKLKGKGGRPELAGNILSEGYSVTGDVATDQDVYTGKAKAHLRKHWSVPAWMTASSLKAQVLVKVAPDGRIVSSQFLKRSGNEEFDRYVEESIGAANPLPPPPDTLQRILLEQGIAWGFPE
jgi:TonB family protein